MQKKPASQSGLFNSRVLCAFALCSVGVLLAMFGFAATSPAEAPRTNTSLPSGPANFLSTSGNNANRLPAGVPLPPGAQLSLNRQSDLSNSSSIAGFPGFAGIALRPGTASGANSLGNPGFANQQPAPLSMQQPAAPESMPLTSETQSDWSIVNSANQNGGTTNVLYGVTCVSASDCWAVGYYSNENDVHQTLIERWDGTSWTIVSSPNVSATQIHNLSGVTCASASDCWAVGYYGSGGTYYTLFEHWDGVSWAIVTSPNPSQNNNLFSVTCVSASDCWAVGGSQVTGSSVQTLIEHWDGTSWSIVTSPNTSTSQYNLLFSVTCGSASDCWAVGNYTGTNANQSLIERWDGASWVIISSPNTSATQANYLSGVTCVSATADCWAIGYYTGSNAEQTLIERWDGTSWAIVSSPNTSTTQRNFIQAVACASASECWAIGYYYSGSAWQNLIERWDGASWVVVTSPNTNATQFNSLIGVTCDSSSNCWAIGFYDGGQTLTEHWNGDSWAIVSSPNAHIPRGNALAATCVSATDCWAVGYYLADSAYQTLIEHWDGTAWAIVTSANTSATQHNELYSVTCESASNCWAAGYSLDPISNLYQTLIERWNGTSWTIVTSPNTSATQSNVLYGVTCVSASECWAIGHYYTGIAWQTLIERWDGTSWTIVSSPNTLITQNNQLYGVTCMSAADCWTVGDVSNATIGIYETLIEHWDGTAWSIVISPNTLAAQGNVLVAVTCVSASNCWAGGYYLDPTNSAWQTLIERWDGTSWTIVSSPSTSATQTNFLNGIACVSASECWAVGYYYAPGSFAKTLIERWDGTSWAIVSSPNATATQNNLLYGVTCTSTSTCWAVGYYGSGETLVLRYPALAPPIPTSAVSRKAHGTAGTFDIDLPLTGAPGIECRNFPDTNSGRHRIVITFAAPVTVNGSQDPKATLTAPKGGSVDTVDVSNSVVTVNLKEVGNEQTINITLLNVSDGTNSGNVSIPTGVLLGDTSANRLVNSTDISQTQAQSGQAVTGSNFRTDVNVNGLINSTDVSIVQSKSGTGLP